MCALAVGIDLGTTNSCVAVYNGDAVEIIQNNEGSRVIPSWVAFTDDGIVIGHEAKHQAHMYIKNSVYEVKRLIGQKYHNEKVQKDISRLPYHVINDYGSPKIEVEFQGKTEKYYPEEISAYVLQKLKDLAEQHLKQEVKRVVVTVPAYFNDLQRQSTKDAAVIAGFRTVNIINEPTAAALAYSYHNKKSYKRNVMVYDFGGGTFDVSIVTVGRGNCVVKATKGDSHLGGTDVDANLVDFVKEDFKNQFDEEIDEGDESLMRRIKTRCEKVKEKLSGAIPAVNIELDYLNGKSYSKKMDKCKFEQLNSKLFEKTMEIVRECLKDAEMGKHDIDEVVLVGGSSRIPKIQLLLEEYFGSDKISKGINPDEAVAYGAAIHATNLVGQKHEVKDVVSLSLGMAVSTLSRESDDYLTSVIIRRNTSIPKTAEQQFGTFIDQDAVSIIVLQGESVLAKDNFELGRFVLSNISLDSDGRGALKVFFAIDEEGILKVTASEIGTDNKNSIKIDVIRKGLTADQIQNRIAEVEKHRKDAITKIKFFETKHELELLCSNATEEMKNSNSGNDKSEFLDKFEQICQELKNISIGDLSTLQQKKIEIETLCLNAIGSQSEID